METAQRSMSWGRDYNSSLHGIYEYCIYEGDKIIARASGFRSSAAAKRAGFKAAAALAEG